ncbi:hypothetical protein EJ05DRAFT_502958 [Pseudovirgaria hyperparasitica]|uniref:Uncharacterized protein n=1 Tax=Pseudovirgaria hyperparasitica TaxID=470096 RepID=A0A6A6W388_9PEZI|nr:uncharacterized protein EJ05DRAFT_502958 [Pseudovirgaria hyperparasitica]KAF2755501.1 hypothetical protein EJ05DRAFT_502958 [Pseudovirgaria hyperparasitica]
MGEWHLTQVSNIKRADGSFAQYEQSTNITTITLLEIMGMMTEMDTQSLDQFGQVRALIDSLILSKVETLRTMHIALSCIGIASVLVVIFCILQEARRSAKLRVTLRPRKFDLLHDVHEAEKFPLTLVFTALIQQAVFVGVQSSALHSVVVTGCSKVAQVVFPAIFLLGYTTFVYGVEITRRSLGSKPFRPKGKWTGSICTASVALLLLFTWIPTAIWRSPDRCFGNLLWFPVRYNVIAISVVSLLIFILILMGVIVITQLKRSVQVDENERLSASLICYYIFLTVFIYTLILPFFIQALLHNFDSNLTSSRLAEVALFGNTLFLVTFYFFLRVNATRLTIKAPGALGFSKGHRGRSFGPGYMASSISEPILSTTHDIDKTILLFDKKGHLEPDFDPRAETSSITEQGILSPGRLDPSTWPSPPDPCSPTTASPSDLTKRTKSSYSIFPTRADEIPRLPPSVYSFNKSSSLKSFAPFKRTTTASEVASITDVSASYEGPLRPPLPLFAHRHRRDSSGGSSATVQIGLRLSVAPATIAAGHITTQNRTIPIRRPTLPAHPAVLRRDHSNPSVESLVLPIQTPSGFTSKDITTSQVQPQKAGETSTETETRITPTESSGEYLEKARDKVLPPIPHPSGTRGVSGLRLNPVTLPPAKPANNAGWI